MLSNQIRSTANYNPDTGEVDEADGESDVDLHDRANMPEDDVPILDASCTVEDTKNTYTDGGFFPLDLGNTFIGYVERMTKLQSQFGVDEPVIDEATGKVVMKDGAPMVQKVQTVYECVGTAYIMTAAGTRGEVRGRIKIAQHERLKLPLAKVVGRQQPVKITYTGQAKERVRKTDKKTLAGAHMFEVVAVNVVKR